MTAQSYLEQALILNAKIKADMEHIKQLQSLAQKVTVSLTGERVDGTGSNNKICDCVCEVVDLQREVQTNVSKLTQLQRDIDRTIESVANDKLRLLLKLRYINCNSVEDIATKTFYSERWVYKLLDDAKEEVAKVLKSS